MDSMTERFQGTSPGPAATDRMSFTRRYLVAIRNWYTVIGVLMVEYLSARSKAGRLSTIFMFAEPLLMIGMMYLIRGILRNFSHFYGTSILLFLVSGFIPFYLCVTSAARARKTQVNPRRRLPRVNALDTFIATTVANALVWLLVLSTLLFGMWVYGIREARPHSITACAAAIFFLIVFGIGVGLINSAIARFVPIWLLIYAIITRGLIFLSGVIHIADFYNPAIRAWVVWNPILHGIEWFRLGLYGRYPVYTLDRNYLIQAAVIVVFVGIVADRASLRHTGK